MCPWCHAEPAALWPCPGLRTSECRGDRRLLISVISVLDYVNRVRILLGNPVLPGLPLLGTEADAEGRDILGTALGVPIGGSERPDGSFRERWVMRFEHASTAERVATALASGWGAEPPEVVSWSISRSLSTTT